jgi:hypothetical protein
VGIDPLDSNKISFLKNTKSADFNGKYICGDARKISEFPDNYFDLIICNFSLYFFINTLPTIVDKIKPSGLFITITHSAKSLFELLDDLKKVLKLNHNPTWNELGSEQVLDNFNAENGLELLNPHFKEIERIEYKNNLEFYLKDLDKLLDLLNFKKTTLIHHNKYEQYIKTKDFNKKIRDEILLKMRRLGKYTLNKNDVIFRCRYPKY